MTIRSEVELRTLIKAIVEAVEEHRALSHRKVLVLANDPANCDALDEATAGFPGVLEKLPYDEFADPAHPWGGPYDVLIMDYMPLDKVSAIALGMCQNPLGCLVQHLLMRAKPVYLLKKAPGSETLIGPYRELFKKHWAALASYGVGFLPCCKKEETVRKDEDELPPPGTVVFDKPFIGWNDVREYATDGVLFIRKATQITKVGRMAVQEQGIRVVRV
jgi:hypothetical protein